MRFTRLRLNGFKSFVDPAELAIAPGLTGVVGPNGCGKSNLLEALRWVMGENRPTAMRGEGMEDVIFAGAASRPARAHAEVALVIDNSERLAPAEFNGQDQIEVVRRITRDAGSAFRINGREVRARDVQMLFADASTGAQSPALVRQGQIAELINARPRNRRRVLEEAAGIAGLHQRRHEAELKLSATEANLLRVEDVLEGLRQQLALLARQARQAARYREIAADLRRAEALLDWRRWREAAEGRADAETALRAALTAAARAEAEARSAAAARDAAGAAMPALREEEAVAAAVLQRATLERAALAGEAERAEAAIAALEARARQIAADAAREAALEGDAGASLERLEAEARNLAAENEGHDARLAAAEAAAEAAAADLAREEDALSAVTEAVARLAARHQAAERAREDARRMLARAEADAAKAAAAGAAARAAQDAAAVAARAAAAEQAAAAAAAEAAEAALAEADAARARVQTLEAAARAARAGAEGEAAALAAEVAALERLVARDRGSRAAMLDRLTVEPGYETALGAALADDLAQPEAPAGASGWVALPPYAPDRVPPLPAGARPLAAHVTAPPALKRRLALVGIVTPAEGAALQPGLAPGQRLVSREGDLWRWDGLTATAADAPTAAALRLAQLNRLAMLRGDLAEAEARAAGARAAHERLARDLAAATAADAAAREARRAADRRLSEATRAQSRAEAEAGLAAGRRETAEFALARHADEAAAARAGLAEAESALAGLPDLAAARAEADAVRAAVDAARAERLARKGAADALARAGEARARRQEAVAREAQRWRARLAEAEGRAAELAARAAAADRDLAAARAVPAGLAERAARLDVALAEAEARRRRAADALAAAETALAEAVAAERAAERAASAAREARAAAGARAEAARAAEAEAAARIAEAQGTDPAGLLEALGADPDTVPAAAPLEAEAARLRRAREALGAVNLRAEEDARETQAEHDRLAAEKADLEAAIARLRAGIQGLNREGRERLLTAFETVNARFAQLFARLFGGGEARLVLVESDDPLEAGLEILAQPPGKKLSTLSLLSGGEQTLTALALIFAVFLANPAPVCVLDEVDAPLDDANVTRFCDLLDEMVRLTETRFLIITHHAVTMARMDRLYGVTMAEQGVSQLVSVDLRRAAGLAA